MFQKFVSLFFYIDMNLFVFFYCLNLFYRCDVSWSLLYRDFLTSFLLEVWDSHLNPLLCCCEICRDSGLEAPSSYYCFLHKCHKIFLFMLLIIIYFLYLFSLGFETFGGIGVDISYLVPDTSLDHLNFFLL